MNTKKKIFIIIYTFLMISLMIISSTFDFFNTSDFNSLTMKLNGLEVNTLSSGGKYLINSYTCKSSSGGTISTSNLDINYNNNTSKLEISMSNVPSEIVCDVELNASKTLLYTLLLDVGTNVTFTGTSSVSVVYGQSIDIITIPRKKGHTFLGYYTLAEVKYIDENGKGMVKYTDTTIKTLYARWQVNTYAVILDNQSATTPGTTSVTATYDSTIPNISVPSRTGYTFGGYYSGVNGTGIQYYTESGVSTRIWNIDSNTTLYANWIGNKYTVALNNQSATTAGTTSVIATYGSAMPTIIKPTKSGYIFGGYYTGANCTGTEYIGDDGMNFQNWGIANSSTTLYACWVPTTVFASVQRYEYKPVKTGWYKLQAWGGQGGNAIADKNDTSVLAGGYGGYSIGIAKLINGTTYYVYVGGQGVIASKRSAGCTVSMRNGGYNGGGSGGSGYCHTQYNMYHNGGGGGGGATHIASADGLLYQVPKTSVFLVAGGGGGANSYQNGSIGGSGGGIKGNNGVEVRYNNNYATYINATGGTQTSGGNGGKSDASFSTTNLEPTGLYGRANTSVKDSEVGGGAGGGLYAGGKGYGGAGGTVGSGSGGSGYIGGVTTHGAITRLMYCWNCATSLGSSTMTISTANVSSSPTDGYAKAGNGYARITYVTED